jgi:hypothetical protein
MHRSLSPNRKTEKKSTSPSNPSDSLAPARSVLDGPSTAANSFRRFPTDGSPPAEREAERRANGGEIINKIRASYGSPGRSKRQRTGAVQDASRRRERCYKDLSYGISRICF